MPPNNLDSIVGRPFVKEGTSAIADTCSDLTWRRVLGKMTEMEEAGPHFDGPCTPKELGGCRFVEERGVYAGTYSGRAGGG